MGGVKPVLKKMSEVRAGVKTTEPKPSREMLNSKKKDNVFVSVKENSNKENINMVGSRNKTPSTIKNTKK